MLTFDELISLFNKLMMMMITGSQTIDNMGKF